MRIRPRASSPPSARRRRPAISASAPGSGTRPRRWASRPPTVSTSSTSNSTPAGLLEVLDGQARGDPPRGLVEVLQRAVLGGVVLVGDLPDDLLDEVLDGHQTRGAAVLVDDERHVVAVALHVAQQGVGPLGVGHEVRGAHDLADRAGPRARAAGGLPVVDGASHQVLEVDHADGVVDVLPDHGDAGVPAAQRQGQRLPHALLALDPHHLGAGHHHLAHAGVAEVEHRLDHRPLAVVDEPAGLGHVDHLAELDLGGERPLAEAASGRDRVADEDQQGGQRAEQAREHPHGPGDGEREPVGVLTAQGARPDADQHVGHEHHDQRRDQQREPVGPDQLQRDERPEHRGGRLAGHPQQQEQVEVARAVGDDRGERLRARRPLADQGVDPGAGHRRQGRVGRREHPGQGHQQDRRDELADQRPRHRDAPPAASSPRPTVPSRRSSAARSRAERAAAARWVRQSASSSACSPNIVRSSSGSAWS